ncbi:DUF3857 domain-containing protein [Bacteroides sp. 214]|uniref:DUF3857 domain-containing protein n=1 Tax=Bacteroides sp. 214 TaxID=2302935 RepID=UPI0013CF5101|nr:DUF3857 domain-containing protein [Bacteroides sp. 214]NDW11763.1 DUF3857 domain-containing protein [Bacteroides sp. 214]
MKTQKLQRLLCLVVLTLSFSAHAFSQETSTKYGKVTDDEVSMTTFAQDTAAVAAVIYKRGWAYYEFIRDDFKVNYVMEKKIKILKPEGTHHADITIAYYNSEKNRSQEESVTQIDATAYNLENGKIVKTKIKKEQIFRERINDSYMQVKLAIPAVKEGTVIEFKYKITSDFYYKLNDWHMQEEIPVMYAEYELTIPEYFMFNKEMRGAYSIKLKEESSPFTINFPNGQVLRANADKFSFTGSNFPALKGDSYVWYPRDYISKITFELRGINYPGSVYKSFTTTWEKIDELLLQDSDFGSQLKMRNPFKEEMATLNLNELSIENKAAKIFCFLRQKMNWNESYALWGQDIKKAIKEGTGNNAQFNFVLISMLKDAGITAYPVVMSRRNRGIIPYTHPSLDAINTFVVAVRGTEDKLFFLDGSIVDGFVNILPAVLLTNRARIVNAEPGEKWIDLSDLGNNQLLSLITVKLNEDGKLEGERSNVYRGQFAAEYRKEYKAAKDSTEYIEKIGEDENISVTSYTSEGVQAFSAEVKETISFTKETDSGGDYLYINPMIFTHIEKNPFTQESRILPVEFPHRYSIRKSVAFTIPEGYQVEELPKHGIIGMEGEGGNCKFLIQQAGNVISLTYTFTIKTSMFSKDEYAGLKAFFENVTEKNNQMIVLKKIIQ